MQIISSSSIVSKTASSVTPQTELKRVNLFSSNSFLKIMSSTSKINLELVENSDNFKKIKTGGFAGATIDLAAHEIDEFQRKKHHFIENELGCMVNAFPYSKEDLLPLLRLAREFDACFVNIISGVMPIDYKEAIPLIYDWMEEADKEGVQILFETVDSRYMGRYH